jgi:hypothetical protein
MQYFNEFEKKLNNHKRKYKTKIRKSALRMIWWTLCSLFKRYDELYLDETNLLHKHRSKADIKIAFKIAGGIGDHIIVRDFINQFCIQMAIDKVDIVLETRNINASDRFFRKDSFINKIILEKDLKFKTYDVVFFIIYQPIVLKAAYPYLQKYFPKIYNFCVKSNEFNTRYGRFVKNHPHDDGLFADIMTRKGLNRYSCMAAQGGIYFDRKNILPIYLDNIESAKHIKDEYITIHDGWDNGLAGALCTKCWSKQNWKEFVGIFKKSFPYIKVVQIGGKFGGDIAGVDLQLRDKIPISQSALILKNSKLHIDGESGLVHLAYHLGVKSIVLFGPTNKKFFRYPQNINLSAGGCQNCWWSNYDWMFKCPKGRQDCMEKITPQMVLNSCKEIL